MVELDVQLSKDLVPVIYHDHFVNIAMKKVILHHLLMTWRKVADARRSPAESCFSRCLFPCLQSEEAVT